MKKAIFAIILFIVGVGLAIPTFMHGVNYYTVDKYWAERQQTDYEIIKSRRLETNVTQGDIEYSGKKAKEYKQRADLSFQNFVLWAISSFIAFIVAIVLWSRYKRGQRIMME
jgi:hypothetical protein